MVGTLICVVAILVGFGFAAHYINSSYEDYKEYIDTQAKNNDR